MVEANKEEKFWEALIDKEEVVEKLEARRGRKKRKMEITRCRCKAKKDEDCICYLTNKLRAKELEEKLGKEKFLKKRLVDELTQILIEYDCP
jgi:hypothetical protein